LARYTLWAYTLRATRPQIYESIGLGVASAALTVAPAAPADAQPATTPEPDARSRR
jgi:hypothetical protein